jgi:hypothetical protein
VHLPPCKELRVVTVDARSRNFRVDNERQEREET